MSQTYKYCCLTKHYWNAHKEISTDTLLCNSSKTCSHHPIQILFHSTVYCCQSLLTCHLHTYIIHLTLVHNSSNDPSARLQAAAAGWLPTGAGPDDKSPMHPAWSEATPPLCLGMLLLIHSMVGIPNQGIWKAWLKQIHCQKWRLLNNLE
jgi:hypothetical protein